MNHTESMLLRHDIGQFGLSAWAPFSLLINSSTRCEIAAAAMATVAAMAATATMATMAAMGTIKVRAAHTSLKEATMAVARS